MALCNECGNAKTQKGAAVSVSCEHDDCFGSGTTSDTNHRICEPCSKELGECQQCRETLAKAVSKAAQ